MLVQDVDGKQHVQVPWQVAAVLGRLLQHTPSSIKPAQHSWAGVAPAPVLQPALCFMQVVERLLLYVHVQCAGSSGPGAAAGVQGIPGCLDNYALAYIATVHRSMCSVPAGLAWVLQQGTAAFLAWALFG